MRMVYSLLALSCICTNIYAAGFDCGKAATTAEELVCKNTRLSELDSMLNRAYRMSTLYASKQATLATQAEQKDWLTTVRDKCKDEECLAKAYYSRLDTLVSVKTSMSEGKYVVNEAEFSQQVADFRISLARIGISAHLSACPAMVEFRDKTNTGRDRSYGAFCLLNGDRLVMICDDTMVGKLTLKLYGFVVSGNELLDFTKANCPPGG